MGKIAVRSALGQPRAHVGRSSWKRSCSHRPHCDRLSARSATAWVIGAFGDDVPFWIAPGLKLTTIVMQCPRGRQRGHASIMPAPESNTARCNHLPTGAPPAPAALRRVWTPR